MKSLAILLTMLTLAASARPVSAAIIVDDLTIHTQENGAQTSYSAFGYAIPSVYVPSGDTLDLNISFDKPIIISPAKPPNFGLYVDYLGRQVSAGNSPIFGDSTFYTDAYCTGYECSSIQVEFNYDNAYTPGAEYRLDGVAVEGGVPEPGTWCLMIVGLALLGTVLRGCRRAAAIA